MDIYSIISPNQIHFKYKLENGGLYKCSNAYSKETTGSSGFKMLARKIFGWQ